MTVRATVVIPTHSHGAILMYAMRSALAQTVRDLEVFVIGDGAPPVTREIVEQISRTDDRVRYFEHPKGPRHGEIYRDLALREARGRIVCYLCDDDLWLPHHVDTMETLLKQADFVSAMSVRVDLDGALLPGNDLDFRIPGIAKSALSDKPRVGGVPLTCMAHTIEAYRRLPEGWNTTPFGIATDTHMTRKFIADPDCRCVSATVPTLLRFPDPPRHQWTAEERIAELARWWERVRDPAWLATVPSEVLDGFARVTAERWINHRWVVFLGKSHARRTGDAALKYLARLQILERHISEGRHQLEESRRARRRLKESLAKAGRQLKAQDSRNWRLRRELARLRESPALRVSRRLARVPGFRVLWKAAARLVSRRPVL